MSNHTWIYDLEVYPNFFLAMFKNRQSEEMQAFSVFGEDAQIPVKELRAFVAGNTLVGFNNLAYDNLVLAAILYGKRGNPTPRLAKQVSNCIIGDKERKPVWMKENQAAREVGLSRLPKLAWDSIDLARIGLTKEDRNTGTGIVRASLKLVAARLRLPSIESLPYPPDTCLTKEQSEYVESYCKKDIAATERLYQVLTKSISLREYLNQKYTLNVTNDHNAAIAEKVILKEFCRRQNVDERAIRTLPNPVDPAIPLNGILDNTLDLSKNPVVAEVREEVSNRRLEGVLEEGFYKYPEIEIPVIVNNKKYTVKLGGLHSADSPAIFHSDEKNTLLHIDAASFYPAIMLKLQSYPSQLGPVFLDILREIRDERLRAKEQFRQTKNQMAKVTADALKIVINSLFGKAGDRFSKLYDAKNLYRVTVNGELYLLKLIEDLEQAGFEVLTANTDGVVVRVPRGEITQVNQILEAWSIALGFELETQESNLYVRLTVNDYLIAHTDDQTTAKGDLAENIDLSHNANMTVVVKAVQEYLIHETSIAETIGKASNPYDFMLFRKSKYGFVLDGKPLNEKIARWFLAKDGKRLQTYKGDGGLADINRTLCESVLLCNDIKGFSWDALDRGHYIKEAQKVINKLEGRQPEKPTPKGRKGKKAKAQVPGQRDLFENLPEDIDYLDNLGMVLCPTTTTGEGKGRPKGWNRDYPDGDYTLSWDWSDSSYTGAAIVTGPETFAVVLDIDNPELAYKFLSPYLPLQGMVIRHGVQAEAIRECRARGAVLFDIREEDKLKIRTSGKAFLKEHGFEIIYQEKAQKCIGTHKDGTKYKISGYPCEIPKALLDCLSNVGGLSERKVKPKPAKDMTLGVVTEVRQLPTAEELKQSEPVPITKLFQSLPAFEAWNFKEVVRDIAKPDEDEPSYVLKYVGHCPHEELHTGASRDRDFSIYYDPDKNAISCGCWHTTCQSEIGKLWHALNIELKKQMETEPEEEPWLEEKAPDFTPGATIQNAFEGWGGHVLLVAPPGSGKTTQAVFKELDAIAAKIPYAYVANNKTDLESFHTQVKHRSKDFADSIFNIESTAGVLCLKGGRSEIEDELVNTDNTESVSDYHWINTHITFAKRKGIGKNFYNFLNWVKEVGPFVVIDEANNFIDSLETYIPFELMSNTARRRGNNKQYTMVFHDCPAFATKSYKCQYCVPCRNIQCWVDVFGNAEATIKSDLKERIEDNAWEFATGKSVDLPEVNFSVTEVIQNAGYIERKLLTGTLPTMYNDEETFTKEEINDLIQCSLSPSIVEVYPTLDGVRFSHHDGVTDEEKARVKFPSRACGKYLVLTDLFPLMWIAKYARGIRFLSTTLNQKTLAVLKAAFPNLQITHPPRAIEKLEGVAVIGFGERELNAKELTEKLRAFKTLQFEPSDRKVDRKFAKIPQDKQVMKVKGNEGETKRKYATREIMHVIANSFGSLGKAVNLTEFAICPVNGDLSKPFIAYHRELSREAIIAQIQNHRLELMEQNGGRILRGGGRKVVVFHNTDKATFDKLVAGLKLPEIAQESHARFVNSDEALVYELATAYIESGEFPDREEKIKETKEAMSKKQRIVNREELEKKKEAREKKRKETLLAKARELQSEGKLWREIVQALNLARYPEIKEEIRKELGL